MMVRSDTQDTHLVSSLPVQAATWLLLFTIALFSIWLIDRRVMLPREGHDPRLGALYEHAEQSPPTPAENRHGQP